MLLKGKRALITGAGSGIGKAVSLAFSKEGCHVVICDINRENAAKTVEEIKEFGGIAYSLICDVSKYDQAKKCVDDTVALMGGIDILANIAGISMKKPDGTKIPFYELTPEQWVKVFEVNLFSVFYMSSIAAKYMMNQRYGRIINMASTAGKIGSEWGPAAANYSASKAGVIGLTRSMAFELAPYGITVNAVAPGRINTSMASNTNAAINALNLKMIPAGRFGEPEEVADLFVFFASDKSAYIIGETTDINGGWLID